VAYTPNSRTFSPTSRPIYAALDFLNGENGGASAYGKSFFELNTDGSRFGEVVVEYPIGHARRRADGIPKLIEKFKINLARQFPT
ncbi:hypothetical protein MJN76_33920, partial [Salmonella enterica subsp. enterica serovar Anatum]|nr:hypothetical protein [Salmonella enterica subsp. enterica serovar Anatum]